MSKPRSCRSRSPGRCLVGRFNARAGRRLFTLPGPRLRTRACMRIRTGCAPRGSTHWRLGPGIYRCSFIKSLSPRLDGPDSTPQSFDEGIPTHGRGCATVNDLVLKMRPCAAKRISTSDRTSRRTIGDIRVRRQGPGDRRGPAIRHQQAGNVDPRCGRAPLSRQVRATINCE